MTIKKSLLLSHLITIVLSLICGIGAAVLYFRAGNILLSIIPVAVLAVLLVLLDLPVARSLFKPLQSLKAAVTELKNGNLDYEVDGDQVREQQALFDCHSKSPLFSFRFCTAPVTCSISSAFRILLVSRRRTTFSPIFPTPVR